MSGFAFRGRSYGAPRLIWGNGHDWLAAHGLMQNKALERVKFTLPWSIFERRARVLITGIPAPAITTGAVVNVPPRCEPGTSCVAPFAAA